MQNPVNWFEIPCSDIQRAKTFYETIFNIEMPVHELGPLTMAWFPMHQNSPGATGSLVQAEAYTPSYHGTLVYFSVEDIEATLVKIEQAGGRILNNKTSIGQFGYVGHFEDSEGNRVALHSES